MNRCYRTRARQFAAAVSAGALAGLSLATLPTAATAQTPTMQRSVPRDVLLGRMTVTLPPVITLDGKPDRLSPGARIRDFNNMVVLSGALVNKDLPIVYKRDPSGLVHEVWILTNEEFAKLGGVNMGDPQGAARFAELLAIIFGLRR